MAVVTGTDDADAVLENSDSTMLQYRTSPPDEPRLQMFANLIFSLNFLFESQAVVTFSNQQQQFNDERFGKRVESPPG